MIFGLETSYRSFARCLSAIAAIAIAAMSGSVSARPFQEFIPPLSEPTPLAMQGDRVVLTGENGQYTGRVTVNAPIATVWEVLTDYDNFARFLPNVTTSRLIQNNGDRKVFEQVYDISAFVITQSTRVRISTRENYPQQIAFQIIEGDLNALEGSWQLEPISSVPGKPPDRVAITHQVKVDPGSTPSRFIFFSIYESILEDTLAAIKQEAERRSVSQL